jgi:hypothetical protein
MPAVSIRYFSGDALHGVPCLRLVEAIADGERVLASADRLRLKGVVSKRKASPYRSASSCDPVAAVRDAVNIGADVFFPRPDHSGSPVTLQGTRISFYR